MSKNLEKTYFFSLTLITSLVIFGSIFYWLFNFSPISQIISAFVALVFSFIFMKKLVCPGINKSQILVKTEHSTKNSNEIKKYKLRPSHLIFIISFCMSWLYLLLARTDRALASPWELISPWFFIFFFLTTLSALTISYRKLKFQLGIFSLLFFTASLVAVVIYSLGYGFDPFIHEAGIKAIKALGAISPKTLYYTGQYVLVIFINQISYIPIGAINQFLVPIFSALFLPFSLYFWQKNSLKTKNIFPLMA
ncbi:MAG: hypothetical protein K9M44_04135, partial [Candidatus Pacebacteria bacterium]|nr:hypothetical protein [Candidatus Paceibacterota bacterium]